MSAVPPVGAASPSPQSVSEVLVLGDGGWGTALAIVLSARGHRVRLWGHDPAYAEVLRRTRRNPKFLPGVDLPPEVEVGTDLEALAAGAAAVLSVVPAQFLRPVAERLRGCLPRGTLVISCTKGIERGTLLLPTEVIEAALGPVPAAVLSGPSHAEEVSRGLPATVVAAARDPEIARRARDLFAGSCLRVYTNPDPLGVEIAGAVKNVIALAAGIADGLELGDNARAALITRGAIEMARFGIARGALRETFLGLAGIGDLIATCTSLHSRNRAVGFRIGRGETLDIVLRSSEKVPEGVETARSLADLAARLGVDMPITREVRAVLFEEKAPREAVQTLMARAAKDELEDLI